MHRAEDMGKDQTYVLGVLTQEQLAHSMFPLGDTTKPVIREEAARRGLAVADKPDSHDICFISDGDTGGWLSEKLASTDSGVNRSGSIVSSEGEVLGSHEGSWRYTIGQRRGLRIGTPAADGQPRYVLDIEPVSGTVTVGSRAELSVDGLSAIRPRWCGQAPTGPLECTVQLRAHGDEHRAVVTVSGESVDVDLLDAGGRDRPRPGGRGVRRVPGRRLGHDLGHPSSRRRNLRVSAHATGVGSMPGEDFAESVRLVLDELPDLPHLPRFPRGERSPT